MTMAEHLRDKLPREKPKLPPHAEKGKLRGLEDLQRAEAERDAYHEQALKHHKRPPDIKPK